MEIKEYYRKNPKWVMTPVTKVAVGFGGTITIKRKPPYEDKVVKEATKKQYAELYKAGFMPNGWDTEAKKVKSTEKVESEKIEAITPSKDD